MEPFTNTVTSRVINPPYQRRRRKYNTENIDFKKRNKTSRHRGYNFEYDIVNAFNNHPSKEWHARRLGGSGTGLPDIVVTNNAKSILYSIEAKSGESNILYIPRDQIDRCKEITETFLKIYERRYVVFAFKFKGNKSRDRKLQYRFVICRFLFHNKFYYNKDCKGFVYDLSKDQFRGLYSTANNGEGVNIVKFGSHNSREGKDYLVESIAEFVNCI